MRKLRRLWEIVFKKGEQNIYRRILRTAIRGSLFTFLAISMISFCSMILLHHVMTKQGAVLSKRVGDYLSETLAEDVQNHLTETARLRAELVSRTIAGCVKNTEFLSHKMTDIMRHNEKYKPTYLPVANDTEISERIPYVYYRRELLESGIGEDMRREVSYAGAIADDMAHINPEYYYVVLAASRHGYLVRLDTLEDDERGAVLSYEPLRSSYDFLESDWYKKTQQADRLILTNPYMASYGKMRISICTPYYDNDGFAGVILVDINSDYIAEILKGVAKNSSEVSFIMGRNGEVLISPQRDGIFSPDMKSDLRESGEASLAEAARQMTDGKKGVAFIEADDSGYYLAYAPIPGTGWSLGTMVSKEAILEDEENIEAYTLGIIRDNGNELQHYFLIMAGLSVLLFLAVLYPIMRANVRMTRSIASPIVMLTKGVQEIARGNLEKKLSVKTGDEIETLAESFNHMTEELKNYIEDLTRTAAQKEHIEAELSLGTRIQAGMLPNGKHPFPERKDFDLSALMHPAREVGGDFYDFFFLDEHHLIVTIADVSGKGVPAALFMVIAKTLLKDGILFKGKSVDLDKIFEKANNALNKSNEENMFVTVFAGILDLRTGDFSYVNAGHNPPLLKRAGRWFYMPKAENPIMGMIEGLPYRSERLRLKPGDGILLYTDGVTEARNQQKGFFGEKRLLEAAGKSGTEAETGIENIFAAVKEFAGSAVQSDDITMLEVIYYGPTDERKDLT